MIERATQIFKSVQNRDIGAQRVHSMASLFRHFRVHQVFGANTDVGKTILTTLLVCASAQRGHSVCYLKPVSTGAPEDADDLCVLNLSAFPNQIYLQSCQSSRKTIRRIGAYQVSLPIQSAS